MFYENYKNIICFDTETTGIVYSQDDIIEFAMIQFRNEEKIEEVSRLDTFVKTNIDIEAKEIDRLDANGNKMTISSLTHISNNDVNSGISKEELVEIIKKTFFNGEKTLITGYNIFFDMNMVKKLFLDCGYTQEEITKLFNTVDYLDFYTIYRDNYEPNMSKVNGKMLGQTLDAVVDRFKIQHKNTHRAIDDTVATWMAGNILNYTGLNMNQYINVFGYMDKYGIDDKNKFASTCKYLPTAWGKLHAIQNAL